VYEQISSNRRKSILLVLGAVVLLGAVGYSIGLLTQQGPVWLVVGIGLAVVMSIGSYLYGDRIVLASTRAREVTPEEQPRLHNIVEGLAIAAGLPKPRVYVVPEQAPNAYATGRNPEHSSIAVTQGLLDTLNRVELEGVVAHEISHILDRDILVGTIVATLVGAAWLFACGGPRASEPLRLPAAGGPLRLLDHLVASATGAALGSGLIPARAEPPAYTPTPWPAWPSS